MSYSGNLFTDIGYRNLTSSIFKSILILTTNCSRIVVVFVDLIIDFLVSV